LMADSYPHLKPSRKHSAPSDEYQKKKFIISES
jgi:hypothetical protein